jgi:hypothetical protein
MFDRREPNAHRYTHHLIERPDRYRTGPGPLATVLLPLGGIIIVSSGFFALAHLEDVVIRLVMVPGFGIGLILIMASRLSSTQFRERRRMAGILRKLDE